MFCIILMSLFISRFFFLMIRRPPRSTQGVSSAASDVYKRQVHGELNKQQDRMLEYLALSLYIKYLPNFKEVNWIKQNQQDYYELIATEDKIAYIIKDFRKN
eukprot:TRINITY_DN22287_c0_g1_i6.p3 TRINITY_DN22287_c0_g1~~TRINITY_DN22287_c0_g1_i6.p3  ORF type:complete len:102 (-),score=19.24 TRINITY_DN22287_c0_g1_i6:155-460(-)